MGQKTKKEGQCARGGMSDGGIGPRGWQDCGMGWEWHEVGSEWTGDGALEVMVRNWTFIPNTEGSCGRVESGRKIGFYYSCRFIQ